MTGMTRYYVSRAVIAVVLASLFALTGSPWWAAVLMGGLALAFFLWAPHSGRYAVQPEHGATALRRDERTQAINDQAARNAFVVSMLILAGIAIYFGALAPALVPVTLLTLVLALGALTYFVSDALLRRS
jgi:cbb3-type cytochrome oxidase maturation protein